MPHNALKRGAQVSEERFWRDQVRERLELMGEGSKGIDLVKREAMPL